MKDDLKAGLSNWSDVALSGVLLLAALGLAALAFWPRHHLLKAVVLAWILLP